MFNRGELLESMDNVISENIQLIRENDELGSATCKSGGELLLSIGTHVGRALKGTRRSVRDYVHDHWYCR